VIGRVRRVRVGVVVDDGAALTWYLKNGPSPGQPTTCSRTDQPALSRLSVIGMGWAKTAPASSKSPMSCGNGI
jgi:hypothetical protein